MFKCVFLSPHRGFGMAVVSGVLHGACFIPMLYMKGQADNPDSLYYGASQFGKQQLCKRLGWGVIFWCPLPHKALGWRHTFLWVSSHLWVCESVILYISPTQTDQLLKRGTNWHQILCVCVYSNTTWTDWWTWILLSRWTTFKVAKDKNQNPHFYFILYLVLFIFILTSLWEKTRGENELGLVSK